MNRSRVALSLLMMVYVLSLLAVGQADDHRKRRVTGSAPMKTAAPVGEASSAIAPAGDSFTYYGPDDEAIADEGTLAEDAFPYAASELAETPENLLGGSEFTAATADEFVESLGVDAPPEYQAEYLRDAQANENVAPLPPVEIAETREPAPVDMLNEELANSASQSADMDLSVDSVLFDTLGQTDDTDEAFYARQQTLVPSPETPVDTCPHFHGCTNGIRCPLIDRCRELMQQWQPQEPAKSVEIETHAAPVVEPVAVTESPRAVCPYSGEYGPSYDLEDYGCPLAPPAPLTHPDVYGLDCDHYFGEAQLSRPTSAAPVLDDYRWNCEVHDPCFEFHGAPTSVTRHEPVTSFDEFADDESMWDCHLADPTYVPVAKPQPTLAAAPPQAKNEPTLAPPRPKHKPVASMFLNDRGELSQLWTVSLADVLRNPAHSEGLDLAWYINVENDGLTRTPRVADRHAPVLGILTRAWDLVAPVAKQIFRQVDDARGQWYADYGYPWDEEAFPTRGFHHDLNLELEF